MGQDRTGHGLYRRNDVGTRGSLPTIEVSGGDAPEPGPVSHTLTLTCNETDGCSFTVDGEPYTGPVTLDEGTEVTIVATPASGYNWVKWSDNETGKTRTLTLDDDISLQAIVEEA